MVDGDGDDVIYIPPTPRPRRPHPLLIRLDTHICPSPGTLAFSIFTNLFSRNIQNKSDIRGSTKTPKRRLCNQNTKRFAPIRAWWTNSVWLC